MRIFENFIVVIGVNEINDNALVSACLFLLAFHVEDREELYRKYNIGSFPCNYSGSVLVKSPADKFIIIVISVGQFCLNLVRFFGELLSRFGVDIGKFYVSTLFKRLRRSCDRLCNRFLGNRLFDNRRGNNRFRSRCLCHLFIHILPYGVKLYCVSKMD